MRKRRRTMCEYCENLIAVGEGDHICCECDEPVVVIGNYKPTRDYLKCNGHKYKKIEVQACS